MGYRTTGEKGKKDYGPQDHRTTGEKRKRGKLKVEMRRWGRGKAETRK
jgi:hypothetical protein